MADVARNFLIHIEFHSATPERLTRVAPLIVEALQHVAGKNHEMVWRSLDRSVIAYVVHTARTARQIVTRFTEASDPYAARSAGIPKDKVKEWFRVLADQDKIAVVELGSEVAQAGYGRLAGWITSHQS